MKNSDIIEKIDEHADKIHETFINERIPEEERYNTIKKRSSKISARFEDLKELDGDEYLDFPKNTELPFFAYGVFKPGEISYPRIECYVEDDGVEEIHIPYTLYERDGIPTVFKEDTDGRTCGYIIRFKENDAKEAYDVIRKVESKTFYEWSDEPICINDEPVNMLFGIDINKSRPEPADNSSYHGVNDVFFNYTIPLILRDLERDEEIKDYEPLINLQRKYGGPVETIIKFFKLQRNYVFLWAAIERYTSLKYGENSKFENNKFLSKEKIFRDSLKYFLNKQNNDENKKNSRFVYNTETFEQYCLNLDDFKDDYIKKDIFKEAINYYYTLRSNVVHRGKSSMGAIDETELKKSLFELLAIFQFVLKDTFEEYKIIDVCDEVSGIKINEKTWEDFKKIYP